VAASQWAKPALEYPDRARRQEWLAEWSRALPAEATLTQGTSSQTFGMSSSTRRTYDVSARIENRTAYTLTAGSALYVIEPARAGSANPLTVLNGYFREQPSEDFSGAVEMRESEGTSGLLGEGESGFDSMGLLNFQSFGSGTRTRVYGGGTFEISFLGEAERGQKTFGVAGSGKPLVFATEFQLVVVVPLDKLDEVYVVSPVLRPGDDKTPAIPFVYVFRFTRPPAGEKGPDKVTWLLSGKELMPLGAEVLLATVKDDAAPLWRRVFAARWAGRHAKESSAPVLTEIVTAEPRTNDALRTAALVGLGAARQRDALTTIAGVAVNDKERMSPRSAAIRALGEIRNPDATPILVSLVRGKEPYAKDAITALGRSEDRLALDPLFEILEASKGSNQSLAARSIAKLADDQSVERLQRDALTNKSASEHAIRALGDIKTDRGCAALSAVFTGGSAEARKNASTALGAFDMPPALDMLKRGLTDQDAGVRIAAARGIAALKNPVRDRALVEAITASDPEVQKIAISDVASRKVADGKSPIMTVIGQPGMDSKVRVAAVDALQKFPGEETKALIVTLLKDTDASVRKSAVQDLSEFGAKSAANDVAAMLRDPDKDVRRAAAATIARIGNKTHGAALVEALLAEKEDLALSAQVSALRELQPDDLASFPMIVDKVRTTSGWARSLVQDRLNSMSGLKVELKWNAKAADVERAAGEWMTWWNGRSKP
jgi:HEAT repeat protein